MKTFCIISDTHGTLNPRVLECISGCDHVVHAGDIGTSSILTELKTECACLTAVLGNCDDPFIVRGLKRRIIFDTHEGFIFALTHRPEQLRRELADLNDHYNSKGSQAHKIIGIHGHTHIPEIRTGDAAQGANLIVCPGSVSAPRGGWPPTFAKIVIDNGKIKCCEIRNLNNEVKLRV